jgi:hypothetical protein
MAQRRSFRFLLLLALAASDALAQSSPVVSAPDSPLPDTPAPNAPAPDASAPIKLGDVTVTGSLRTRFYSWDWFEPTSGNNSYVYSGNILRFALSQSHDSWDWDAEFAVPFMLGLPSNATGTGPQQGGLGLGSNYATANSGAQNTAMIFPKQLFVRFDELAGDKRHQLQIGRFEFLDGAEVAPKNATLATLKRDRVDQRLIGPSLFTDVGRSFDGVRYSYATDDDNFTFVAAVPTRGIFQTDGWGWNRVGFGYGAYTRQWGKGRHAADTRAFFIEYDDFRHILKTDNRPLAVRRADLDNIRINTFGGHTLHALETQAGTLDFLLWAAAQTGQWGVQVQRAGAVDVEGGFQPSILPQVKPWLRGGLSWASGDGNPNDNTHGTFFQLLPSVRPYALFPFYNMMNMHDEFGTLILHPHAKLTLSSDFHSLRLANANDLWYSGTGAYQPWTFGYTGRSTSGRRSLANLYDTNLEYRIRKNVVTTAYFGYAQGLAVMEEIYPKGKNGRFGYLELLYRF